MIDFDAAIIGYGPVGATLANLLGGSGLSVVVIEKDHAIFDKPRAIGIDHESLRTLQFCGMADEIPKLVSPWRGGRYLGVDGDSIWELVPRQPPYPLGWFPNAAFIQPELEAAMRLSAERHANVDVLLGTRLIDLQRLGETTDLVLESDNVSRTIRVKYLLGCDGAKSTVRRALGVDAEDLAFDEWWVVVDGWCENCDDLPSANRQYCWPSRPGTYVVGPRNLRRWEFKVLPGETPAHFDDISNIKMALSKYVDVDTIKFWRSAQYRFHAVIATRWQDGNIFILGDAAHQTPPFLGQGMNSGIRDAANLYWKIAMVEKFGAAPSLLLSYQTERRPHFKAVVQRAKEQGLIIGELDEEKAIERDRYLRQKMARGELTTARQNFIPGLTEGLIYPNGGEGETFAGALFPQPLIRNNAGDELLMDDQFGAHFLLALSEPRAIAWINATLLTMLRELRACVVLLGPTADLPSTPGFVERVEDVNGVFREWLNGRGAPAILVRPDRYIYGAAKSADELRDQVVQLHRSVFGYKAAH